MTPNINVTIHMGNPNRPWLDFSLIGCKAGLKNEGQECDDVAAMKFLIDSVQEEMWYLFNLKRKEK